MAGGMASLAGPPILRIVQGVVETRSATSRLVIPTSAQPAWPPYDRAGETVASRIRQFPSHAHEHQEVLTYMIEGSASYQLGAETPRSLRPGSARLLTAPSHTTHRISPAQGGPIRWFSLVIRLPEGAAGGARLQGSEPPVSPRYDETAQVRPLVGPGASMTSALEVECAEIVCVELSTTFRRLGHGRRGIVYVLAGRGSVDGHGVELGEAALIEGAAGMSIQGKAGFRAIAATAPVTPAATPAHG
jgi:redox-sensitive bicupin YhaK (pirin superfamily)